MAVVAQEAEGRDLLVSARPGRANHRLWLALADTLMDGAQAMGRRLIRWR